VKFRDDFKDIPYLSDVEVEDYLEEHKIIPWSQLKEKYPGIDIRRVYTSISPERINALVAQAVRRDDTYKPPNFLTYFFVDVPAGVDPHELAKTFLEYPSVETAYFDPPLKSPTVTGANQPHAWDQGYPRGNPPDSGGPDGYLNASPKGIDAVYAWTVPGGDGFGQDFIDLEQGWTFDHEDLPTQGQTPLDGDNIDCEHPHGTAVLGIVCGADNAIGIVGIAPNVGSVKCVSYKKNGIENRPNAIMVAIANLPFGGVLLLEVEICGPRLPIELLNLEWNNIRLATALGITVVEAAGNGNWDLDDAKLYQGDVMILSRKMQGFQDSGAIMVGAGSSTAPHTRVSNTNYGSRIDCYAQGEKVATAWSTDSPLFAITGQNAYTSNFNGTSSAAAVIAGAALVVQGIAQQNLDFRFNAWRMRSLLSDQSGMPSPDQIGIMPDLKNLVSIIKVAPDVYIRDFVGDTGKPHAGAISASPDIILRTAPELKPQDAFGEGSGTENSNTLGDEAQAGQDNYIYVRARNHGRSDATNVTIALYWAPPATLLTPDLWEPIQPKPGQSGVSVDFPMGRDVPTGNILTVSDEIVWPSANIPGPGNYCFIAFISSPQDPAPKPADFKDWDNYRRFIRDNNNVTWRNFNVV
jgi:serine protease